MKRSDSRIADRLKYTLVTLCNRIRYGSTWKKPFYMLRLLKNLFLRICFNKRPLRGIDFAVDFACDLKCAHCFNRDILTPGNSRKMGIDDYARVFKEAEKEGILNFCFQGGEFLILKNWQDILRLLDSRKFSISVTTNGTHLDEEVAKKLKELGVNTVTVSIDSGIAAEHDEFRGQEGSHAKALKAIENSLKQGFKVVLNATITPASMRSEGFLKLLEYAAQKKTLLNTIFAAPSGNWSGKEEIIMRDEDISEYKAICKRYPNVVRDMDSLYLGRGCPAANESIYITPYGDVFACAYIHITLGNIFTEPLHQIRKRGRKYFKYQSKCPISENRDFIEQYNRLVKGAKALPLPYEAHNEITAWDS
ncbi:MAG: radical SAM protein [Candidatus Omnitrophica bacterium]|nr:radical SAM protein [Candidatus Omnitrophota bacterium]